MKKYALLILSIFMVASLLLMPGCKRNSVADPDMDDNAGYFINLSGIADPATLLITQGCADQHSQIRMTALYNNGEPIVGKQIFMKINDEIGFFPGGNLTSVLTTNSQGKASVTYTVTHFAREKINAASYLTYLQAYIENDLNPMYGQYDLIPVQILTDLPDIEVNTFMVQVIGSYTSIPNTGGSFQIFLYNSTGTESISYSIQYTDGYIPVMISAPPSPTTGSTENTVLVTVSANTSGATRDIHIYVTATAPADVAGTSYDIHVDQQL